MSYCWVTALKTLINKSWINTDLSKQSFTHKHNWCFSWFAPLLLQILVGMQLHFSDRFFHIWHYSFNCFPKIITMYKSKYYTFKDSVRFNDKVLPFYSQDNLNTTYYSLDQLLNWLTIGPLCWKSQIWIIEVRATYCNICGGAIVIRCTWKWLAIH